MNNFLSRIFKKNLIGSNEDIRNGIPKDVLKKYKHLLRKAKYSFRINGIRVRNICGYEPDVSCKIYRRKHQVICSDSYLRYFNTKLYEFLDDNDANFVVKVKITNSEEVLYEGYKSKYFTNWYLRYFYKIYFSKDGGKTWYKIIYDIDDFDLYSPIKSKNEKLIRYEFKETIDYNNYDTDKFGDRYYHKLDKIVEREFNTYEKCKSHNEEVLRTIMENNANSLSSIFGVDLQLNS